MPEIWGRICKSLSVQDSLQLSAADKHTMGRLVAAGVLDTVDLVVTVGRYAWPVDIRIKRYMWFNSEYIMRITTSCSATAVKSTEHGNMRVLTITASGGHRYIYTADGKAEHMVITSKFFGESRDLLVLTVIAGPVCVHEFIGMWADCCHSGTSVVQSMKVDSELEKQLTALYKQSDVPAQQGPHSLLMRPDVVALLSPK